MKRQRILVLVRDGLVPPDTMEGYTDKEIEEWKCEFDVIQTLRELGHEVHPLGVYDDLGPLKDAIADWKPDIAFMLLEEFHGVTLYDHAIVSYLELMRQPYTGCNPLGTMLSRKKALAKKILLHHDLPTPRFTVVRKGRRARLPRDLRYPLLVKSDGEDASHGISQASVVHDAAALHERVDFLHESGGGDALVEEYIEGRELYVGVIGNDRLQTFPIWEMDFNRMPEAQARIATAKIKFNEAYRDKYGVTTRAARGIAPEVRRRISNVCKQVYRELEMSGYARMDLRLTEDNRFYLLEANANPNLSYGEDFAESAETAGVSYEMLLEKIVRLGLQYEAPWQE
ncbi:MAG: D-alanine--D-alanine ligase [Planctomycetota bacterium]|nr:MAG: D-alanine--D-alanine ligase [Planctomycetota bacterium]REK21203.1 MAG: D-alanine--D-alanine ligase [Planctomycetota bacterium]REK29611.1 MAG: D-alanine--D-alanine ligase [Planctomycetota bacterium]